MSDEEASGVADEPERAAGPSSATDFLALLREQVRERPDAPAFGMIGDAPLSYAELDARITGVVNALHANGFRPGDRMLFSIRPCVDAVILVFGAIAAGGTIVFVDPGVGPELFARRIDLVQPAWAATESLLYLLSGPLTRLGRARGLSLPAFADLPVRHIHSGIRLPGTPSDSLPLGRLLGSPASIRAKASTAPRTGPTATPDGTTAPPDSPEKVWGAHAEASDRLDAEAARAVSDATGVDPAAAGNGSAAAQTGPESAALTDAAAEALIVFTSGTTAAPKAVVHTRGSLGAGLAAMAGRSTLGPGAHLHTEQLMMGLPALMAGARWSMPRYPRFGTHIDPLRFARTLDSATHAFFTPADLAVVLTAIESGRLPAPALREISLGGAPVTTALLRRARAAIPGCEFLAIYGMTEILPVAITSGTAKLEFEGSGDPLGAPVRGVVARIAQDGELVLSGPNLCHRYLGEPPLREIPTGDLARMDGDTIILMGRKKDMMIRGKTNIYPGLYEPAIATVEGVRQAIMIGVPDEIGDERIILAVVPAPDTPELLSRLRRELPTLMDTSALPDDIVLVPEIPVSGRTSKPDRAALRAQLTDRLP
ncbi:class I adenylate-forming enzyme family protein [Nocardia jejuensis]|uniref:class I adenylate-forming enzyme family protein n=1 Tax=Nocardia jejuensis TaxID=328049 RepID=UPI000A5B3A10|nr:class I adenylate-forming enzyme family protein [Nocardia jejuensis]